MRCSGYTKVTNHVTGHKHNKTARTKEAQGSNDHSQKQLHETQAYSHQILIKAKDYELPLAADRRIIHKPHSTNSEEFIVPQA
jgi:hypothetical protein